MGGVVGSIAGGIGSAIGGKIFGGSKGGGGGSSGGGGTPFIRGYDPSWNEEYSHLKNKWVRDKANELGRAYNIGGQQRDRLISALNEIFDYGMPLYDELSQEKAYREYKDYMGDTLRGVIEREGPAWEKRVDRAEQQRLAAYEQALNKLLTQNERMMARGGVGFINPERRDEMVARNLAIANDQARDQAIKDIEESLLRGITVGGQAVLPHYAGMSDRERAREIAGLNFYSQNLLQKEGARQAYENAITDIMNKYRGLEPNPGAVKRQYYYQSDGMPVQGGGSPGSWGDVLKQGVGSALPGIIGGVFGQGGTQPYNPYVINDPWGGGGGMALPPGMYNTGGNAVSGLLSSLF